MVKPLFIVTEARAAHRQSRCYGELVLLTFIISKAASTPGRTRSARRCKNTEGHPVILSGVSQRETQSKDLTISSDVFSEPIFSQIFPSRIIAFHESILLRAPPA